MNHSECWDLLSPSLDGELDSDRAREVAAHVGQCQDCRGRLGEMAAISRRIRSLDKLPMPEDVRASLRRALNSASSEPAVRGWRTLASPWTAASLVAAGLLVVVGILSLRPEPAGNAVAGRLKESPARVDDASDSVDGERQEASQQPEAPPPASPRPEVETRPTGPGRQDTARDARDTRRRRVGAKTLGQPEGPAAKADQATGERLAALSKKEAEALRSLGYVAADAPRKTMPPASGVQPAQVPLREEAFTAPAGLHATTLIVSGDAVSFAPMEPRPGGRAKPNATDGTEIAWRIQTPSFAPGGEAKFALPAEAPEPAPAARSQSASTAKQVQGQLPDPARVLAQRRGPGGTITLLVQVDERGLIYEANPVGAQTMEPEVAAAVAQLLRGSSLVPYPVGQPARPFPLEVTVPPAEAPH